MIRQVLNQARKHPSLIPPVVFIGAGATGAELYVLCLAFFNPDVCWDRKNNPEPWNKLGLNDCYKLYYELYYKWTTANWRKKVPTSKSDISP